MFVPASDFFGIQTGKQSYRPPHAVPLRSRTACSAERDEYTPPARDELATTSAPDACDIAWIIVFAYAATVRAGAFVAVRSIRRRRWTVPGATSVFLAFVVTFSVLASNMFELGEKMRFRLETDPLVLAATAALAARARAVRAHPARSRRTGPGTL